MEAARSSVPSHLHVLPLPLSCVQGELFDMVVDYPDSLPAVKDLAACLRHTSLQVRQPAWQCAVPRRTVLHTLRTVLSNRPYKIAVQASIASPELLR